MTKEKDALTMKQRAFVTAYCLGQPNCPEAKGVASKAYQQAYRTENMKQASIYTEACRLLDNPKVSQSIKTIHQENKEKHSLSADKAREKIFSDLLTLSCSPNENVQLKALQMLGSFTGVEAWGSQKVETSQKLTIETTEDELMASIASAINDPRVTALFNNKKSEN